MSPNESLKLTANEIDAIITATAYNVANRTLSYNKSKVLSNSVASKLPEALTKAVVERDPQSEQPESSPREDAYAFTQKTLGETVERLKTFCTADIESFPKKLAIAVGIQSRLLNAKKSPTGTTNITLSGDEYDFVIESLRIYEEWEVNPIYNYELVIAAFTTNGYDSARAQTPFRSTEDNAAILASREDFIVLLAKVISYGKTLASGSNVGTQANDQ